jgi:hypothetical protein
LIHYGFIADREFLIPYARDHGLLVECTEDFEGEIIVMPLETMYAAVKAILGRKEDIWSSGAYLPDVTLLT